MSKISFSEMEDIVDSSIEIAMNALFSDEMQKKHGWDRESYERIQAETMIFQEIDYEEGESLH
jgi:hypothetical protein